MTDCSTCSNVPCQCYFSCHTTVINDIHVGNHDVVYQHEAKSISKLSGFRIVKLHLNCRSVIKYIEDLRLLILSTEAHVISLNETRLHSSVGDGEIDVPGYNVVRCDRNRDGGGVLLYIKDSFNYMSCEESSLFQIEAVAVKILLGTKHLLISTIYRPPSANIDYFHHIHSFMEKMLSTGLNSIFLGDFNLDISKQGSDQNKVLNLCNILHLKQLVQTFTRVTCTSSTTIDLVFSNIEHNHSQTGVLPCSFSDHQIVYTVLNMHIPRTGSKHIRSRCFKKFNYIEFISDLLNSEIISNIYTCNSLSVAWHTWKTEFCRISDKHAPIMVHRLKNRKNPWMSTDIVNLIYKRQMLHKLATKCRTLDTWDEYRRMRNKVNNAIHKAKKTYFNELVQANTNNCKGMWQALRYVMPTRTHTSECTDITSDTFNNFFTKVGVNLTKHFDSSSVPVVCVTPPESTFSFSYISTDFIYKLISNLPNKAGLDSLDFDHRLLKCSAPFISASLSYIFNLSLETGNVPSDWKSAVVTPIFKARVLNQILQTTDQFLLPLLFPNSLNLQSRSNL